MSQAFMGADLHQKKPNPEDQRSLRTALGQFATGVTAIVGRDQAGELVGLTANSFTSVSLDPPLVLWSLRQASRCYPAFRTCGHFVINVLAADQIDVARRFSAPVADRFGGLSWMPSPVSGLPVIEGVAAWFDCKTLNFYDAGDHTIFVGEVSCFSHAERAPLLFHAGSYGRACEALDS